MFQALGRYTRKLLRAVTRLWRWLKRRNVFSWRAVGILLTLGLIATGLLLLWAATLEVPDLTGVQDRVVAQSTKIYDRTGQILLYDLSQDVTRTQVPISDISPFIQEATIALEDKNFYQHHGIEPLSILRSILANITSLSFAQGGSTITQQVIKNSLLTQAKTPARKIKEWVLALKIERVLTKQQILEIYLNESPYGGSLYGVEEASKAFFGKSAHDLTLAESAYLASLPQAPTYFSPSGNHRAELDKRKNLTLDLMLEQHYITQEQHDQAKNEVVTFSPPRETSVKAPHFVFYVRELLEAKYGASALQSGGYRVITSLDYPLQVKGEEIAKKYALDNATKYHATNASIVAIDPTNGDILTMVGSRDYFDKDIQGNYNIALANRQPGSSFKPFVYAAAFNEGYTPDTVVFDLRTQFSTNCDASDITNTDAPCYSPQNYDNKFRGPVTLRDALAQSLNIPAVKVLYLTGINNALQLAKAMGVTSLTNADQYGLTLVLGGGEVRLLDMVSAYGGFATNGYHVEPNAILRVEDASGNILEQAQPVSTHVLSEDTASQINDVLSDNDARTPSFGADSVLYFPNQDVAVKTGTTNDYRDAWVIGYTPNIVAGAWAGNNDNTPMEKKVAGFIVAPLWNAFMKEAVANRPVQSFTRNETDESSLPPVLRGVWQGGLSEIIDTRTNTPAGAGTPSEFIAERVSGGVHDILYWIDKSNPTGPRPTNPGDDPQFSHWELPVRTWAASQGYTDATTFVVPRTASPASTSPVSMTPPSLSATLSLVTPANGTTLPLSSVIVTKIASSKEITQVKYYFNGVYIGAANTAPFAITLVPSALLAKAGEAVTVRAVATLQTGGEESAESSFTLK
jgi:1A family penicillin-binding protein